VLILNSFSNSINTILGLFPQKIKNQNANWNQKLIKLILIYLELKMNQYYLSINIWVDTIIALKKHNLSIERIINHLKASNQHY
jgi:hypothetical protein